MQSLSIANIKRMVDRHKQTNNRMGCSVVTCQHSVCVGIIVDIVVNVNVGVCVCFGVYVCVGDGVDTSNASC